MKKKIGIFLLLLVFIFSIQAYGTSEDVGSIYLSDEECYPGRTVALDVVIGENPGFTASIVTVSFDMDVLTLTRVEDGGKLGTPNHSDVIATDEYNLSWFNPLEEEDYTYEGCVATLYFEVAEDAEASEYTVEVTVQEAYNSELAEVAFTKGEGTVTVLEPPDCIPGDVNGDLVVNRNDLLRLAKHFSGFEVEIDEVASDVTGDGEVTRGDLLRLAKYFSGFEVELGK